MKQGWDEDGEYRHYGQKCELNPDCDGTMKHPQGSEGQRWTLHTNGAGDYHLFDGATKACPYTCGNGWDSFEVVPASLLAVAEAKAKAAWDRLHDVQGRASEKIKTLTEALRVAEERLRYERVCNETATHLYETWEKAAKDSERKREEMLAALRRWEAEQVSSVADEGLFAFLHSLAAEPKGKE